jgi:hypothetical protein
MIRNSIRILNKTYLTIDHKIIGVVSTETELDMIFFLKVSEISNFKFQNKKKLNLNLKLKI